MAPPPNLRSSRPRRRPWGRLLLLAALVAGAVVAYQRRWELLDAYRLRGYQAPAEIDALAARIGLTRYATRVFHVNRPQLLGGARFSARCPNNGGEHSIILGCYHPPQRGIFLLDVQDPRLDGVEQVTAAHELLHAAYERLDGEERDRIDALLEDFYLHGLKDRRLVDLIALYRKTEPGDVASEMHSVFGTEVPHLPPALERYYRRYFADRGRVAAFAAAYQHELTSRRERVARDDAELDRLKRRIDEHEQAIDARKQDLDARQADLLALREADPEAFNARVPAYNAAIEAYNALVVELRQAVQRYNRVVKARNEVVLEEDQLARELANDAPMRAR